MFYLYDLNLKGLSPWEPSTQTESGGDLQILY